MTKQRGELTPIQNGSKRWQQLFEVLNEWVDDNVEPRVQRIENLRSVFSMHPDDLAQKLADLGSWFDVTMPVAQESKPLAVLWRKEELLLKNTLVPLRLMLRRNFDGLDSRWTPLYCRKTDDYKKENLKFAHEIETLKHSMDDYFLTSRGYLTVDVGHLHKLGYTRQNFLQIVEREAERLVPLRVVYEGERFLLIVEIDVPLNSMTDAYKPHIGLADVDHKTSVEALKSVGVSQVVEVSAGNKLSTDQFVGYDEVPADFWPLDMPLYFEKEVGFPKILGKATLPATRKIVLGKATLPVKKHIVLGKANV